MARVRQSGFFVVEDDPVYQRLVKYIVEMDSDHEVHAFETGAACLANLNLQPDIISLDYSLPDMTGEEVRANQSIQPRNRGGHLIRSAGY